jgi:hypothetical protein
MNKLANNRFVSKIKNAFKKKREAKDQEEEDTSEISSDLLGFNMNTLFENKNKRRKKVHLKKDGMHQGKLDIQMNWLISNSKNYCSTSPRQTKSISNKKESVRPVFPK